MTVNPRIVKAALRKEARVKRAAAHAADPDPDVEHIAGLVLTRVHLLGGPYKAGHLIATYLSVGDEFPTKRLNGLLVEADQALCVPAWDKEKRCYVWSFLEGHLVEGPHGILQPAEIFPVRKPEHIELAIVPGLAFSPDGARLGHGAGIYDRLLKPLEETRFTTLVGLCYDAQLVPGIPLEEHDAFLPFIATETRLIDVSHPED